MVDIQSKQCAVCHESFIPDKRVGSRQLVCFKLHCQQERKRRAQRRWVSKNPGYFQERYLYVKAWLAAHPGYLRQYRARNKVSSGDIQDELTFCKSDMLGALQHSLDIQDEIISKITVSKKQLRALTSVIYKTSEPIVFDVG